MKSITVDIPLFMRLLEFAREDAKTDLDLHVATENIIKLSECGCTLTMDDYNDIVKASRFGCEYCYETFKDYILIMLNKCQTGTIHVGKRIKPKLSDLDALKKQRWIFYMLCTLLV